MSALTRRRERGIDAIKEGDRETAEHLLDEVSAEPGSMEPLTGLLEETEQRFYELRARLLGEVEDDTEDDWDDTEDDWDDAWDDTEDDDSEAEPPRDDEALILFAADREPGQHLSLSMEYAGEDGSVEVERHEESFRERAIDAHETRDTLVTVQTYNASVTLQPHAVLPEVVAQNLAHDIDPDREWSECHVEEYRVLKTTLVYKDEPGRPALPCACLE